MRSNKKQQRARKCVFIDLKSAPQRAHLAEPNGVTHTSICVNYQLVRKIMPDFTINLLCSCLKFHYFFNISQVLTKIFTYSRQDQENRFIPQLLTEFFCFVLFFKKKNPVYLKIVGQLTERLVSLFPKNHLLPFLFN